MEAATLTTAAIRAYLAWTALWVALGVQDGDRSVLVAAGGCVLMLAAYALSLAVLIRREAP